NLMVKGIRSIRFDRIDSAIWKDKDKARSRILFRCLCKVTVTIPALKRAESTAEPRRFKIAEPPPIPTWVLNSTTNAVAYAAGYEPTEEIELPFDVYGAAELQRADQSLDWELLSINVDKSVAVEEYNALVAAEIPQGSTVGDPSSK